MTTNAEDYDLVIVVGSAAGATAGRAAGLIKGSPTR